MARLLLVVCLALFASVALAGLDPNNAPLIWELTDGEDKGIGGGFDVVDDLKMAPWVRRRARPAFSSLPLLLCAVVASCSPSASPRLALSPWAFPSFSAVLVLAFPFPRKFRGRISVLGFFDRC